MRVWGLRSPWEVKQALGLRVWGLRSPNFFLFRSVQGLGLKALEHKLLPLGAEGPSSGFRVWGVPTSSLHGMPRHRNYLFRDLTEKEGIQGS